MKRGRTFSAYLTISIFLILPFVFANLGCSQVKQGYATVALVQLNSTQVGDFQAMTQLATEAKSQGADLVIFPESSAYGWLNPAVFTNAQPIPGIISNSFAEIASSVGIWLATGLAEQGSPLGGTYYNAFDAGLLINPAGEIVLHHRKYSVLKNAFNPSECPPQFGSNGCQYEVGSLTDLQAVETPFGRTSILVCADAYTWDTTALTALKKLDPEFVIVPWGVAAGSTQECGEENFNATDFAAKAAKFLGTAYVVGANGTGSRPYGRFLPSWYCGTSGYATPSGEIGGVADTSQSIAYFDIPVD